MDGGASIPRGSPPPGPLHLDTSILIPVLVGWDREAEVFGRAEHAVSFSGPTPPHASLIAIGEAFTIIATEADRVLLGGRSRSPSKTLVNLVRGGRLEVCWLDHHHSRYLDLVQSLKDVCPKVGLTDRMIVASALACQSRGYLYAFDDALTNNPDLDGYCHKDGRNLTIREPPSR